MKKWSQNAPKLRNYEGSRDPPKSQNQQKSSFSGEVRTTTPTKNRSLQVPPRRIVCIPKETPRVPEQLQIPSCTTSLQLSGTTCTRNIPARGRRCCAQRVLDNRKLGLYSIVVCLKSPRRGRGKTCDRKIALNSIVVYLK